MSAEWVRKELDDVYAQGLALKDDISAQVEDKTTPPPPPPPPRQRPTNAIETPVPVHPRGDGWEVSSRNGTAHASASTDPPTPKLSRTQKRDAARRRFKQFDPPTLALPARCPVDNYWGRLEGSTSTPLGLADLISTPAPPSTPSPAGKAETLPARDDPPDLGTANGIVGPLDGEGAETLPVMDDPLDLATRFYLAVRNITAGPNTEIWNEPTGIPTSREAAALPVIDDHLDLATELDSAIRSVTAYPTASGLNSPHPTTIARGSTAAGRFLKLGDVRPANLINLYKTAVGSRGRHKGSWPSLDPGERQPTQAEDETPPHDTSKTEPVDPDPSPEAWGPAPDECVDDASPGGPSGWLILLLWVLGTACLDPLTTCVSLHAFGSTCLYYASVSTMVGLMSLAQTALDQMINSTRTPGDVLEYPSTNSPERTSETTAVPPEDPEATVPDDPDAAAAEKSRFLQKYLLWPDRRAGFWHSSVGSRNKIRRANLPPGQVKRKPKWDPPSVDAEAWANAVMSHFFCSPEANPPAWHLYMREADVPTPSAGQFPLSPLGPAGGGGAGGFGNFPRNPYDNRPISDSDRARQRLGDDQQERENVAALNRDLEEIEAQLAASRDTRAGVAVATGQGAWPPLHVAPQLREPTSIIGVGSSEYWTGVAATITFTGSDAMDRYHATESAVGKPYVKRSPTQFTGHNRGVTDSPTTGICAINYVN